LRAVERCVALAPNSAHFIGYRAYILSHFGAYKEALRVAESALRIDPNRHIALLARANAFTKTGQWIAAEQGARRILALNAEDTGALNLLAQALRFQGRHKESREVVAQILARVPEDAFGQANAGFEALNADDHERANRHFVNALRINPHSDNARRGLLQSLRARMWFYRVNLKILNFFNGIKKKPVIMRMIFVFCIIATGGSIVFAYMGYVLVAGTLQPISNFFLLFEPTGRRALTRKERAWAIVTGVAAFLLFVLFAVTRLWILDLFLGGYLALFALGVYVPQWIAEWQNRREEKRLAAELPGSSA
jgi:tetratricopeptide (TPR) repeat protein